MMAACRTVRLPSLALAFVLFEQKNMHANAERGSTPGKGGTQVCISIWRGEARALVCTFETSPVSVRTLRLSRNTGLPGR